MTDTELPDVRPGVRMATAVGAVLFVVGGSLWGVEQVQGDLAARSRTALLAVGIPVTVRYEGLDAVLAGTVSEPAQAADAIGVVAQVPGTRHVRSRIVVLPGSSSAPSGEIDLDGGASPGDTTNSPSTTTRPPTGTGQPPAVRLRLPRGNITFVTGDAALSTGAKDYLDRVAVFLAQHPQVRLVVRGHSDDVGSDEINWALSRRRAVVVTAYLESRRVRTDRLQAEAFAATSPIAQNDTSEGRAANRRVELVIEEV
jgi:outer membrane protein OmpA-like peptidoglycan-associated protein